MAWAIVAGIVFVGLVVGVVVYLLLGKDGRRSSDADPLAVLAKRHAGGEIDRAD